MTKEKRIKEYDILQEKVGSKERNSVYGGGKEKNPELCLVFINPTARNIATDKNWTGVRYQWLGTKQIWQFLTKAGLFSEELNNKIQNMKVYDWTTDFCEEVFREVANNNIYITNLAKCTQDDARQLPDSVFKEYKNLFFEEVKLVNPRKIVLFGNQISSIILDRKISVSEQRKKIINLKIDDRDFDCFAVYYPVGNGFFNAPKAIEDLKYIKEI